MRDTRRAEPEQDTTIDPPRIVETARVQTAVVHVRCPRDQIRSVMGPGREELMSTLTRQGITPAGPWFTHHLKLDPAVFDFEIGVPVMRPVEALGRVAPGELPATTVARTVHRGGYEGLSSAWQDLGAWITAQGRRPAPSLWEVYLTDPEATPEPASWRTELSRPLLG